MARISVYLPDDLAEEMKRADLNVSRLTQAAIRTALAAADTNRWLDRAGSLDETGVTHESAVAAVAAAREDFGR
ncbi:MAG: type II toxin-antitoxin system CcdA family antitoxin [Solirubrobacterales bacterium]